MKNPTQQDVWWKITCTPKKLPDPYQVNDLLDEIGFALIEHGAVSTAIESPPDIVCFFRGDEDGCKTFLEAIHPLQVAIQDCREVTESNWNEGCPEVWVPIDAGRFHVVPVSSTLDPRPTTPDSIRIIPGQGFGTGHHATTKMVLEALSDYTDKLRVTPSRVLDFGTGSGILAIAAAKALDADVDALDIDPDALRNAEENVAMNQVEARVHLTNDPLTALPGTYDLILANVYGEVLVHSYQDLTRLAAPRAHMLMSGVTELVKETVIEVFCSEGRWTLQSEQAENDWMCLVFTRQN